ncbi:helix-turn-helix transcriptional regulator [Streptomyces heilongjiangensis]|uniref:AAA family ATPase n=1 Tax=Streptomyces heilongjiangensis TaxID=945052 RepID=A0ABW1BES1_9ACTN|nr:AAA family ATPase [Streptomyces heilongjiangensis]MDC2950203.1 AAA family ATPase [Streptomyces heilongjiangensis]
MATRQLALRDRLTGRSAELALLIQEFAAARSGRRRAVLVRGPAGVGKSALLDAVIDAASQHNVTVLHAVCEGAGPHGVLRQLFRTRPRGHTGASEGAPVHLEELRALLEVAAAEECDGGGGVAGSAHPPPAGHMAVSLAVHRVCLRMMARRPLVLVVDDVHHCDSESWRALNFLLHRVRRGPLLLLVAGRDRPGGENVPDCLFRTTVRPGPLRETHVAQLVQDVLDGAPDDEFVRTCAQVSGGNPGLLLRILDALRRAEVRPTAAEAARIADIDPEALRESVAARMADLSAEARDVAAAVAVVGLERPEIIGPLIRVPPPRTRAAVEALRERALLAPDRLGFAHAAVRRAVAAEVPMPDSEGLLARAALLMSDARMPVRTVADHLILLSRPDRAWMADTLREAGAEALRQGEPRAAARYLRHLVDHAATVMPGADPAPVRGELAAALARFDPAGALTELRAALDSRPAPCDQAQVALQYGEIALAVGGTPDAADVLVTALDAVRAECPATARATELATLLESTLLLVGLGARAASSSARARIADIGDRPPAVDESGGGAHGGAHRALAARTWLAALAPHSAASATEPVRSVLADPEWTDAESCTVGLALLLADETDPAHAVWDRTLARSRERGDDWTHHQALSCKALGLLWTGALDEAIAAAQHAVHIAEQAPWRRTTVLPFGVLALTLSVCGHHERADAVMRREGLLEGRAADLADTSRGWSLPALYRAQSAWRRGAPAESLDLLLALGRELRAGGAGNPLYSPWWEYALPLLAVQGRAAEAGELLDEYTESSIRWGTPRALGHSLIARARTVPPETAVGLLTEAVQVLQAAPDPIHRSRGAYLLGRALLRTGDVRAARKQLEWAAASAERCGARDAAAAAGRLLAVAGGRVRRPAAGTSAGLLTRAERRTVELAARGLTNRQIAEALFVAVRTVETHLTHAYRKLGVGNRKELLRQSAWWRGEDDQDVQTADGPSPVLPGTPV